MTPEDWQRLWQGHEGGGPRNSPADLLVRSQQMVDGWKNLWLFSIVGALWIVMGGLRLLIWSREGSGPVLMFAIANLAFGVAFIVQGPIGMRMTRNLPPAVTAVDFYRKLLEIEHRRLRVGIPLIIVAAFNLFAFPLTMTRFIPLFSSRLLLAVGSVVVYAMFAVYALRRMARKRREIRDLPDDT